MENRRLLEALRQVHIELAEADRVDPEALALLRTLTHDIERVLSNRSDATPSESESESEPPSSRLRELLLKFEAEHPELSTAIGKVADGLAAMGI